MTNFIDPIDNDLEKVETNAWSVLKNSTTSLTKQQLEDYYKYVKGVDLHYKKLSCDSEVNLSQKMDDVLVVSILVKLLLNYVCNSASVVVYV